jgi:hypothetical protein
MQDDIDDNLEKDRPQAFVHWINLQQVLKQANTDGVKSAM